MEKQSVRKVVKVLEGETFKVPPIWLMRQAGRYLPEYRELRKEVGGFLDLCYTPEKAIEVTMQPIRRFDFDAAILFSDILVVPDAMKRSVRFVTGEGPRLDPISVEEIKKLSEDRNLIEDAMEHLSPVFEAVSGIRSNLADEKTLIGFCGAPWTVATYMIAGRGSPDQALTRRFSFSSPEAFSCLLDLIADVSIAYLIKQIKAGADVVQIFDSWSGVLGPEDFIRWSVLPVKRMVDGVRKAIPDAKIIGFPKGAAYNLTNYHELTGIDGVGLDWTVPFEVGKRLQKDVAIQGNLDPMKVLAGGSILEHGIDQILENFSAGPLIFNLGHGITPEAPIGNVETLMKRIRG